MAEASPYRPSLSRLRPISERSEDAKPLINCDWGYLRMVKAMKDRKAYDE